MPSPAAAINSIPDHGITERSKMNPYLMGSSRLNVHLEEGCGAVSLTDAPARAGILSPPAASGHLLPVRMIPSYGRIDDAVPAFDIAMHQGMIGFPYLAPFKLGGQSPVRLV